MHEIGTKRLLIVFCATLYLIVLSAPLYTSSTAFDCFYRTRLSNKEALIKISTMGGGKKALN